ncbi:MAG: hypothetical protein HY290_32230 [Planctomycetia bacterium]|nr:hypothetical protein [Planctomycetia bacterium]
MLRRLWTGVARTLVAPSSACFAEFAMIAICLATWSLQFITLLGTSLPAALALVAALSLGFAAGARQIAFIARATVAGLPYGALLHFAMAAWMVASPRLVYFVDRAISQPGVIDLASPGWNSIVLFGLALVCLGLPAFFAAQLAANRQNNAGRRPVPLIFLGAAAGLAVWGLGLAQIMGPYYCGLAAAGTGLVIAVFPLFRRATIANSTEMTSAHTPIPDHGEQRERAPLWQLACEAMMALACGGWVAAIDRLIVQLSPVSVYTGCAEVIGLCAGLALGIALACRNRGLSQTPSVIAGAGMAVWGVGILAAYPLLIDASLWLNAHVSSTNLLIATRGLATALALVPAGAAAAICAARKVTTGSPTIGAGPARCLLLAAAGYCLVTGAAFPHFTPDAVVIALAWLTIAAVLPGATVLRRQLFVRRRTQLAAAAVGCIIVISPVWRQHFDPVRSARLLFNSRVTYAYRSGLKASQLVGLDEGRFVTSTTGQRGIFTLWSYGGHQLQVRENGLPRGVVSTDPEAFPRYAPETLQTVVPCLLHGNAERVLLLGLGSGESLSTALAFPIREIVCLETDAGLVRIVRDIPAAGTGASALADERVTLAVCDPALGLPAVSGDFDVVVSTPENLSLAQAQPYVTAEFYQRAARKLSAGGIFCQRLQHIDLGPRPIQGILRAMQSAFRDVAAVEGAPGELLVCGCNDPAGLIRPGLVARLEAPHVRSVLGESGLDWTVLLNVAAINREGIAEFCRTETGPLNTAGAGRLPFSLPRDMLRWAPKFDEIRDTLGKNAGRLLNWVGEEGSSPVVVRRLAEVQGQFDLMTRYSDQYWAYRASLRDQVKEKPRSAIQLASATDEEPTMHAEDRRRVAYFNSLSRAIKTHRAADIERLAKLAIPYDPLITYFVHQEAAELYSRSPERDLAAELRFRLHATFFSSPRDASLRNVIAGLDLLCSHPQCEPDPRTRWDDVNSLLQALKLRWETRIGTRPSDVKEAITDCDRTVLAAEQAFHALESLAAAAGVPQSQWAARRSVLEKTLIAPVRAYQRELLPLLDRSGTEREAPSEAESQ